MSDQIPDEPHEEAHDLRGTFIITLLFILFVAGLWVFAYSMLIERGGA